MRLMESSCVKEKVSCSVPYITTSQPSSDLHVSWLEASMRNSDPCAKQTPTCSASQILFPHVKTATLCHSPSNFLKIANLKFSLQSAPRSVCPHAESFGCWSTCRKSTNPELVHQLPSQLLVFHVAPMSLAVSSKYVVKLHTVAGTQSDLATFQLVFEGA